MERPQGGSREREKEYVQVTDGWLVVEPNTVLRLVKPLEHLQTAITTANTPVYVSSLPCYMTIDGPLRKSSSLAPVASNVAQLAQIARQLCYAGYLSTDMIVWLQSIKFLRIRAEYVLPARSAMHQR